MRRARIRELERVTERGIKIDTQLVNKCAYYPLFRFIKFKSKETDEIITGHQLLCKDCSFEIPNERCKHSINLIW